MATFFGYYFLGIILFSALSGVISAVYGHLIIDEMAARYPVEYKEFMNYLGSTWWWSKRKRKLVAIVRNLGDANLNSLATKLTFFWNCAISIFITAPVGMLVFLILVHSNK